MTVQLNVSYLGQQPGNIYSGPDEAYLLASGFAQPLPTTLDGFGSYIDPGELPYANAIAGGASQKLLVRIQRNAARAAQSNPRTAGLYAGSVTVTDRGATQPTETPGSGYLMDENSRGIFHAVGGRVNSSSSGRLLSATSSGGLGITTAARIDAMTDGRYLGVKVSPTTKPIRFLVDDGKGSRFISMSGTTLGVTSGSTPQYLLLDFVTSAVRKVTADLSQNSGLYGFFTEPTAKCWASDISDAVHAAYLGDSYIQQSPGPAINADGLASQLGDRLGVHMHASGVGGTGWTTNNASPNFGERIALGDLARSYYPPNIIFTLASLNDRSNSAAMGAAVTSGLQAMRALYPGVPIIMFGASPAAMGYAVGGVENNAAAAMAALNDPLMKFVRMHTDPLGQWITGTGFEGSPNGSGNTDRLIWTDAVHPNTTGCEVIGQRQADAALAALVSALGV